MKTSFFTREIGAQPGMGSRVAIEPPAALKIGKGVPVVPLVPGQAPGRWLFAGPFEVDEKTDVLADEGGAAAVQPEVGMKVAYRKADGSRGERAFHVLDPNHSTYDPKKARARFDSTRYVITQGYANALGNPRLAGGINFATASGRKYNTTCYVYTVLEVSREGTYRVELVKGRIRSQDIWLAGRPIKHEDEVRLTKGRYPLMVRTAIAVCGNWEPIEWAILFRLLPSGPPQAPPQPLSADAAAKLRMPVTPLLLAENMSHALLGAWPLSNKAAEELAKAVLARGGILAEGEAIEAGGAKAVFQPVPASALARGKGVRDRTLFNAPQMLPTWLLAAKALLGEKVGACGVFTAVVDNRRDMTVEFTCPEGLRCWLGGREVRDAESLHLAPGWYPMIILATAEAAKTPVGVGWRQVADPAMAKERWLARVRRSEGLLRMIAASGSAGTYARQALDAAAKLKHEVNP